ncbi:MAG: membrane protein insertase YidC [Prevotella sp.]|nr:membrane protein insertase YidC [Prevotella sp.]MCM1074586.1 membrane protein insertase YidC [Ruminococcus sp.]
MDKNTIRGLVLIGLVFIVFMWINSGKQPEQTQTPAQEKAESNATEQAQTVAADLLTEKEVADIRQAITEYGQTAPDGSRHLQGTDYDLCLAADTLSGFVTVGNTQVPVAGLITADDTFTPEQRSQAVKRATSVQTAAYQYGPFSRFTSGTAQTAKLENDVLALDFTSQGAQISRAELKKYFTQYDPDETKKVKKQVVLFDGPTNSLSFTLPGYDGFNTSDLYFEVLESTTTSVLFGLKFDQNSFWGIRYSIKPGEDYVVNVAVEQQGMDKVLHSNGRTLGIEWNQLLRRQEQGKMFEERNSALYYKYDGGDVEDMNANGDDAEAKQNKVQWIAFKNQFFSSVLVAKTPLDNADFTSIQLNKNNYGADADTYLKYMSAAASVNKYDWAAKNPVSFDLFLGPNLYPLLSGLDDTIASGEDLDMTQLIPLGWSIFRWINTLIIIPVFNFLGSFGWNYGIIILLLTIFIKIVLFPLTYKSYKSQAKMRILAPDIKAINEKYPGQENAMVRQQKTMALYSKAGANPMSGCLPLLLQMPILFAMFSFFPSCIELRGQSFLWCHDLSAPDAIISWNAHIPLVTEYFGNHISLFCLLMTVTNILYTRINMQTQGGGAPGMKWMMYLMPVFFMIFFNNYAAGLSYYYFLSLLITIVQSWAIRKWVVNEDDVRKAMAENAKKPRKKSGFMARLEEAQKRQQEMLRQQQAAKAKNNGKSRR